jgi:hypothetical protein
MTLHARKVAVALAIIAALASMAGCATSPQEPWFELQDRLLWMSGAD